MRAVILAAGRGVRMMPLTADTPKPLLKVGGRAIIDYVFEALPDEIDEVIVVVKYLGGQIVKHVVDKYKDLKVTFVQGSDDENVYSFLNTGPYLDSERFLLIYGDEIPNPNDVKKCLEKDLSMLTFDNGIYDGVMVLNTSIFDYEPTTGIFTGLVKKFMEDNEFSLIESENFIGGLNTPEDLTRVEKEITKIYG